MQEVRFKSIQLKNFKAFENYSIQFSNINILVGPNNSGKSTILNAFRIISAGLRRAYAKSAELVPGPEREMWGYRVPLDDIPMSFENVHNNYDTQRPATVTFVLSNKNKLVLYFTDDGRCMMIPEVAIGSVRSPATFKKNYPISVGFVPVLGPLEHDEQRVEKQTVVRNLFTHRASRHFRNYWRYFPEDFDKFAALLQETWPGMVINRPETHSLDSVSMFVEEDHIPRELYWAGFGFQIWCQLLTHIVRSSAMDLLVIDEPEIYLHPDLQRRLLLLLRSVGPDILLATHSTEMVMEAEPQEIVVIDKTRTSGFRLRDIDQVQNNAVRLLGSRQNITLTQLAKTRRVLFVEGTDFKILSRFAQILGLDQVANQSEFAVVATEGFSQWPKLQALQWGFEKTLGESLLLGAVFDRDYRCDEEIADIRDKLKLSLRIIHFHSRKELENYLLLPPVLDRVIQHKVREFARTRGLAPAMTKSASEILLELTATMKADVQAQYIDNRVRFLSSSGRHSATVTSETIKLFDSAWNNLDTRLEIVPGKQTLSELNRYLQDAHRISLTPASILSECRQNEVPADMVRFLRLLSTRFCTTTVAKRI